MNGIARPLVLILLLGCSAQERTPDATSTPWKLTFSKPFKPLGSEKTKVLVTMERIHANLGKLVEKHWHLAGDRIGWWSEKDGESPVSVHQVALFGGATTPVDFDTGVLLVSVEPKTVQKEVTRCKPIFDRNGTRIDCEQLSELINFSTHEVVFRGAMGEQRILVPDPDLSQYCPIHAPNQPRPEYTDSQKARMPRWIGTASYDNCRNYIRPLLEREGIPYQPWEKRTGLTMIGTDTVEHARRGRELVQADAKERDYTFYMGFDPPSLDEK